MANQWPLYTDKQDGFAAVSADGFLKRNAGGTAWEQAAWATATPGLTTAAAGVEGSGGTVSRGGHTHQLDPNGDFKVNSLGVGAAANGARGRLDFGTAAKSAAAALNDATGALDFTLAALYTFTGALRGPNGSLAAPAFAFTTEVNTGLRLAAAGDLRAVVAGTDVAVFLGTGRILAGTLDLTAIRGGSTAGRNDGSALTISGGAAATLQGLVFDTTASHTATAGTQEACRWAYTFAPTSGTAAFQALNLALTINQAGGANGSYDGIRVTATETAVGGSDNALLRLLQGATERFKVAPGGLVTVAGRVTGVAAPTAAGDATRADEAGPPFLAGFIGTIFDTAVRYSGPFVGSNVDTVEDAVSWVASHACVLRSLRLRTNDPPNGADVVFDVMVNGAATAMTATYLTTDTGTKAGTGGPLTLAAGDRVSLRITPQVGYTQSSMSNVRWSCDATRL